MKNRNIGLVGGFASTNIGNDFFTRGIEYALQKAVPDYNIIITQNLPGYYWREGMANPGNSFNYLENLDLDYLVLTGPLFDTRFPILWKSTLSRLIKKGTRIMFFSAGSQKYDKNERDTVRKYLKTIEPYALITRDTPTYEAYGDLMEHSYDGIDFASFVNDYFKPYPIDLEKYIILNFDTGPEPQFGDETRFGDQFIFKGRHWSYRKKNLNKIGKILYRKFPGIYKYHNSRFGEFRTIRLVNYVNPGTRKQIFRYPDTFSSELANDYLNLFANSEGILSSRVHSCLASLAFGKEAMLFSKTLRGQLFDRFGLQEIRKNAVSLDADWLAQEKELMINFLKTIL